MNSLMNATDAGLSLILGLSPSEVNSVAINLDRI